MKTNRSVKLTEKNWKLLLEQLKKDQPISVVALRSKMREVLGFTVREDFRDYYNRKIHLDFFDDKKKTMFLLKYGGFLDK